MTDLLIMLAAAVSMAIAGYVCHLCACLNSFVDLIG